MYITLSSKRLRKREREPETECNDNQIIHYGIIAILAVVIFDVINLTASVFHVSTVRILSTSTLGVRRGFKVSLKSDRATFERLSC